MWCLSLVEVKKCLTGLLSPAAGLLSEGLPLPILDIIVSYCSRGKDIQQVSSFFFSVTL